MKIGILTLPLHTNYGGILQAYALQTVLEKMGHEVEVINKQVRFSKPQYWKYPFRLVKKLFFKHDTVIAYEKNRYREYPIIYGSLDRFKDEHIHSKFVTDLHNISHGEYDAIIVGSDQVWRPTYFKRLWRTDMSDAFLGFANSWNIKRISYATSFGVDNWELTYNETTQCRALAQLFNSISVRENSGVRICKEYLGVESVCVLDPTMLLGPSDYIELFKYHNVGKSKGNLLCYILDDTPMKRGLISRISRERHLTPFSVNGAVVSATSPVSERIKPSIEEWLRGFYDAEFVITDSFHACVFSIIFRKPFIVIGNTKRGMERFVSLLSTFSIKKNLLSNISEYDPSYGYEIPSPVSQIMVEKQRMSIEFLKKTLA